MSPKQRTPLGRSLNQAPSYGGPVHVAVSHLEHGISLEISGKNFAEAERTFPIDCAYARRGVSLPEIHLVQLNPANIKQAWRLVVVRMPEESFVARAPVQREFLSRFSPLLSKRKAGDRVELAKNAAPPDVANTAIIDADFEVSSHIGSKASTVFFSLGGVAISLALQHKLESLNASAVLEATMHVEALADLLESWVAVATETT